jgi:hypothetical protein
MSELDSESFLGIVDIPKYPSSRGIKTARSYHPWRMSPRESYPFDHVAPMLTNGWIYFGTYYIGERNLKLALDRQGKSGVGVAAQRASSETRKA